MKRFSIALVAMAFATTCLRQAAPAEEANGIPDEIVRELDGIVGTWKFEGKLGDEEQVGEVTLRWERTADKKKICLSGRSVVVTNGKESHGRSLIGWNSGKNCIEDRRFYANGGNDVLYWTVKSATHWQGETIGLADGSVVTGKADLIKKSDSEFVFEAEYDNGVVARSVLRKVKRERKRNATE